ncbi:MAG: TetR family transcriptional regulator [Planctomycetes bacterium]|nr:TetR family transcriptional regulator [Planctomycetota bacterium]
MSDRGAATRERILDAAHRRVMDRGFAATPLDAVLADAGVTKGAFFHHFESKADLAEALARRYAEGEAAALEGLFRRAAALSDDPLQRVLLVVGLLAEAVEGAGEGDPGCLLASYCYEKDLMTPPVRRILGQALGGWRKRFGAALREAAAVHPPRAPVDFDLLADHSNAVIEGAFIMARVLGRKGVVAAHLREFRRYLELLFEG